MTSPPNLVSGPVGWFRWTRPEIADAAEFGREDGGVSGHAGRAPGRRTWWRESRRRTGARSGCIRDGPREGSHGARSALGVVVPGGDLDVGGSSSSNESVRSITGKRVVLGNADVAGNALVAVAVGVSESPARDQQAPQGVLPERLSAAMPS